MHGPCPVIGKAAVAVVAAGCVVAVGAGASAVAAEPADGAAAGVAAAIAGGGRCGGGLKNLGLGVAAFAAVAAAVGSFRGGGFAPAFVAGVKPASSIDSAGRPAHMSISRRIFRSSCSWSSASSVLFALPRGFLFGLSCKLARRCSCSSCSGSSGRAWLLPQRYPMSTSGGEV